MKITRAIASVLIIALVATLCLAAVQVDAQAAPSAAGPAIIEFSGRVVQVRFHRNLVIGGPDVSVGRTIFEGGTVGEANMPVFAPPAGRTFIGWNTHRHGTGSAFTSSTVVSIPEPGWGMDVYAMWIFTGGGGNNGGGNGNGGGGPGNGTGGGGTETGGGGGGDSTDTGGGGTGSGAGGGPVGGGGGAAGGGAGGAPTPPMGGMDIADPIAPPMGGDGGIFDFIFGGGESEVTIPGADGTPSLPGPISVWEGDSGSGLLEDSGIPSVGGVLLYAPEGVGSWSLLNLILGAIGAIFAVMITVRAVMQKKREQGEEDQKEKRHGLAWLLTTNILGVAGVVLFVIFQDMSRMMVFVDRWTIVHVVIFAVQVLAIWLLLRSDKDRDSDQGDRGLEYAHA